MISFGQSWWLLLLVVPILVWAWEATRRGLRLTLPLDHACHPPRRWLARSVRLANALPAMLLAVAVLILARPLRQETPRQERQLTNVEFVLDVSGSMTSRLGEGTRYDAALKSIEAFTSRRQGDAFGLTIFGNEVLRWTPLTKDVSAIRNATPFLRPESLPEHFGGTEIGKALRFCHRTLRERGEGDALIILLSDGESADLGQRVSREIGTQLAAAGVVLHAIHIGDEATPRDLYDLTGPTGGRVFATDSADGLMTVFAHIDRMQPVKLKPVAPQAVAWFAPLAAAGLVLLGLYQLTLFGLRFTPW
jgi:Ca-activated chloride channel family protein